MTFVQSSRRRSGGICLREPDSDEESEEPLDNSESEEDEQELEDATENVENQEEQKKRIDDIWTSMKNDSNVKNNSKVTEEAFDNLGSLCGFLYILGRSWNLGLRGL